MILSQSVCVPLYLPGCIYFFVTPISSVFYWPSVNTGECCEQEFLLDIVVLGSVGSHQPVNQSLID